MLSLFLTIATIIKCVFVTKKLLRIIELIDNQQEIMIVHAKQTSNYQIFSNIITNNKYKTSYNGYINLIQCNHETLRKKFTCYPITLKKNSLGI